MRGVYGVRHALYPVKGTWSVCARPFWGASDSWAVWCRDVVELRAVVADLRRRRFRREECARRTRTI